MGASTGAREVPTTPAAHAGPTAAPAAPAVAAAAPDAVPKLCAGAPTGPADEPRGGTKILSLGLGAAMRAPQLRVGRTPSREYEEWKKEERKLKLNKAKCRVLRSAGRARRARAGGSTLATGVRRNTLHSISGACCALHQRAPWPRTASLAACGRLDRRSARLRRRTRTSAPDSALRSGAPYAHSQTIHIS